MRTFTARQLRILEQLASGMTPAQIADATMVDPATVRDHVSAILRKTHCESLFQLGAWIERTQTISIGRPVDRCCTKNSPVASEVQQ